MTPDIFHTCACTMATSTLYTYITVTHRHNTQPLPSASELQALAIVYFIPKGGSTVLMFTLSASPQFCATQSSHFTFHCSSDNI